VTEKYMLEETQHINIQSEAEKGKLYRDQPYTVLTISFQTKKGYTSWLLSKCCEWSLCYFNQKIRETWQRQM